MKLHDSSEVAAARRSRKPLVALETSVLAQGLPAPENSEAARRCGRAVREAGAVPVPMAVIDGKPCAGLEARQLERLLGDEDLMKIGLKDLALAIALGRTGGTTVSATCAMAAAAGVPVFATGGLGGVHRGAERTFDISQDLLALARWPVGVVCAGVKSILDVPRTLELLETLGVLVVGVGTREVPGFYTRETGLQLEHQVSGVAEAARVLEARRDLGQGGIVFFLPPPRASSLPRALVEKHLRAALALARRRGVTGKAVTPFLLAQLGSRTGGQALRANLDLLEQNASFAGQLAVELASL
jgi:pseudouridine-5'-phosphate glycosidase